MQMQTLKTLDQLLFVHLEISCWSGKKTLTPDDLGLDRTQLPPETLISLGDKQLINPDTLRAFTSVRSAARRQCLAVGARFMGGYAIPTGKAAALLDRLTALEATYTQAKADFLATYDQALDAWARQQPPEWQKLIREALVPVSYVSGRLDFRVQVARFSLPETVAHPGLATALHGLRDQIFYEIAQDAREALEKSFQGKTEITRRALSPLLAMRDKLEGLVFVHGGFRAVMGEIERLLACIPTKGPVVGRLLHELVQFLALAAQPDGLKTWADAAPVWVNPCGEWAWPMSEPTATVSADAMIRTDSPVSSVDAARGFGLAAAITPPPASESVGAETTRDWFF